jgi:hypothetical protein
LPPQAICLLALMWLIFVAAMGAFSLAGYVRSPGVVNAGTQLTRAIFGDGGRSRREIPEGRSSAPADR